MFGHALSVAVCLGELLAVCPFRAVR